MKTSYSLKTGGFVGFLVAWYLLAVSAVCAAPPVRIAVVPGGGSGMEQSAVDGICEALGKNGNVTISTVNPDWFVVCNILEQTDAVSGTVKVNGSVTVKTTDGQIIDTVAVQTNKSDFSLQPGAPLNKSLVNKAVQEVIVGMAERAVPSIENAVAIEIATRDRIIQAQSLADKDNYDEAIALLMPITPDTTHFKAVRALMGEYQMEKESIALVNQAEALAKKGRYSQAIEILSKVNPKSKRHELAKMRIVACRSALARLAKLGKNKAKAQTVKLTKGNGADAQLKALEAQKHALEEQKKALEAQEAAIKNKSSR